MRTMKKLILKIVCLATLCNFAAVVHAQEVDSYFVWEIKDRELFINKTHEADEPAYLYNKLFRSLNANGIDGMRDEIYSEINRGDYSRALFLCETAQVAQKIAFGKNYFDEGLLELSTKLYLIMEQFDKAETNIEFLLSNVNDDLTKIRALNLKSDLYNHLGKFNESLEITKEVTNILQRNPDENLFLINQARVARAYCGFNETKKSLELAENIFPRMQNTFGKANMETLALMSTLSADYLQAKRYDECKNILEDKSKFIGDYSRAHSGSPYFMLTKTYMERLDLHFATNDIKQVKKDLAAIIQYANIASNNGDSKLALPILNSVDEIFAKYPPKYIKPKGYTEELTEYDFFLDTKYALANAYSEVGDIEQSINICEEFIPKLKKISENGYITLNMMGLLRDNYLLLGRYKDAEKIILDSLKIFVKHYGEDSSAVAASKIDLANIYYRTGRYKVADNLLSDIESDKEDSYDFLLTKAVGKRLSGEYMESREIFNQLESVRKKVFKDDTAGLGGLSSIIEEEKLLYEMNGKLYSLLFPETSTMTYYKPYVYDYAPKLLEMSNTTAANYIATGELQQAERITNQVLRLSRQHLGENNFYEWAALNNLAKIRRAEGNFSVAIETDKKALYIAKKVCGDTSLERLVSLESLAEDYTAAGNFNEAINLREKTLAEYRKNFDKTNPEMWKMMTNLADNYVTAGRYSEAQNLCEATINQIKVTVPYDEKDTLSSIDNLLKVKAKNEAKWGKNEQAASTYFTLILDYEYMRSALDKIGNEETKSKWFEETLPVYKASAFANADEANDRQKYAFYCTEFCKGRNLIDRYNDVLVSQNHLMDRRERENLARYQILLNSCREIEEHAADTNDDTLLSGVNTIREELYLDNALYKNKLRKKYSEKMIPKNEQENSGQQQSQQKNFLHEFNIEKNRKSIPDQACLLEFMKVLDEELIAFVLRNNSDVQATKIFVDKAFWDKCRLYHDLNAYSDLNALHTDGKYLWQDADGKYIITEGRTSPNNSSTAINDMEKFIDLRKELSIQLSQKLITPVEKFLYSSSHWIVSSDAELNIVPFETLIYRDEALVNSVDVSYVPSLTVLNLMKNRERKNFYLGRSKELFAMGDAVYGNNDAVTSRGSKAAFFGNLRSKRGNNVDITKLQWSNLPGTAHELDKVSNFFNSKDIFRQRQVTEINLRELNTRGELSKYKYLLFATHGLFVPEMPELSSIVLSQNLVDNDNDGYVTVGEWMGYDLGSDLIYLSACESGLGDYQAGEGIVGIPYALTVAGNKDTVMSLWKVNDEATAEFTASVFEKLSKGKSEVAALNETKREFLQSNNPKYRDPSVWAAFVLYGI